MKNYNTNETIYEMIAAIAYLWSDMVSWPL